LIGGSNTDTALLAVRLASHLSLWFKNVLRIDTVTQFDLTDIAKASTVLSFIDLDSPIFKDLTESGLDGL